MNAETSRDRDRRRPRSLEPSLDCEAVLDTEASLEFCRLPSLELSVAVPPLLPLRS
jgi:hypothetical protein